MAQKFVGIDLGIHSIKGVVVTSGLRGVQVLETFEEPVGAATLGAEGEAPDLLGTAIGVAIHTLRSRRLMGEPLGISLPGSMLSYRVLNFPFSDERRIAQAVGFEADGQFPTPLDELAHDHVVVPATGGEGRALVVAARRDRVEQISTAFTQAGADLKVITSSAAALSQVADATVPPATPDLVEQGLKTTALLVDIGHGMTDLVALGPKGPLAVRSIRKGGKHVTAAIAKAYGLDIAQAEAGKHNDAFLPHRGFDQISDTQMESGRVVAAAIESFVRELEHTRLWLRSTHKLQVTKLLLAGGGAALNGLTEYLEEQLGLPVEPVKPKPSSVRGTENRVWTGTAAALGVAFATARRPVIQLHDTAGAGGEGSWLQERMSTMVALAVAIMAFGALDTIAQVKALEREQEAYVAELETVSLKAFGAPLTSPTEVEAKLAEVEGQDLTSLIPERGGLEVLALIAKAATPSDVKDAKSAAAGVAAGAGLPLPSEAPTEGADAPPGPAAEGEEPPPEDQGPIDPTRGVVLADGLVVNRLDIRERKIELKASANNSSAQDRLKMKLGQLGCIKAVQTGKVRGDERKSFEMTMDNDCFTQEPASAEEEAG